MVRWSIAVFTLHFLLGLGASAFGMAPVALHSPQANARSIQMAIVHQHLAASQIQDADSQEQVISDALECTLADASQDLPDDQNVRIFNAGPCRVLFHCPTTADLAPSSPWLRKQPKRPRPGHMLHSA